MNQTKPRWKRIGPRTYLLTDGKWRGAIVFGNSARPYHYLWAWWVFPSYRQLSGVSISFAFAKSEAEAALKKTCGGQR